MPKTLPIQAIPSSVLSRVTFIATKPFQTTDRSSFTGIAVKETTIVSPGERIIIYNLLERMIGVLRKGGVFVGYIPNHICLDNFLEIKQ